MVTRNAGTRWMVDIYDWVSTHPSETDYSTERYVGENIVSITVNRGKTPDSTSNITVRGRPKHYFKIGNWVVIRVKKGAFNFAQQEFGTPIFIGQITHVTTTFAAEANGLNASVTSISLRPWSSLLQTPIIYDIFGIMQVWKKDASILGVVGSYVTDPSGPYSKINQVVQDIVNPWRYVTVVLSFLGAISEKTRSAVVDEMSKNNKTTGNSEEVARDYAEVATKLPKIPQELLDDLDFPNNVNPDNAFGADNGFMSVLLGVQKKDMKEQLIEGAFQSLEDLTELYTPVGDRPVLSNVGPEFAEGRSAWDLIRSRTDRDNTTEMFADIWYHKDGNKVLPRPVFVLRDKPLMLRKLKNNFELTTAWTDYDSVPVVDIDAASIVRLSINNTFFNSPNYSTCRFTSPTIRPNSNIAHEVFRSSRVKSQAEMNRFGGISYTYNTPYVAQTSLDLTKFRDSVSLEWYKDLAYVQWAWHHNDYRTWHGSMMLKDPTIPISVGLNIRFKVGKIWCVAQVQGISYSHQNEAATGKKTTSASVSFSNLVVERTDGKYEYPGVEFHSQVQNPYFDEQKDIDGTINSSPIASYSDALAAANSERDETVKKITKDKTKK